MELEESIINIYLRIEKVYLDITKGCPLRKGGFAPKLTDVETITIEVIGEMQSRNGDRSIWQYCKDHWLHYFPNLPSYKTFAKQCANLTWIKQRILEKLFPPKDKIHIVDGVPMPICHNARAYRSRMLGEHTSWGYCAAKDEHYHGLKGHLVIGKDGNIADLIVTPANVDERTASTDIINKIKGLLIGDKGYIGQDYAKCMAKHGIDVQTPLRKNMLDSRPKSFVKLLMRIRKSVETALSVLIFKFSITKIKAHNIHHFKSKLTRKILAYNFYNLFKKS